MVATVIILTFNLYQREKLPNRNLAQKIYELNCILLWNAEHILLHSLMQMLDFLNFIA